MSQSQLEECKVTITEIEEENSDIKSQLMLRKGELRNLKEDNKLLINQFIARKDKQRREAIPQVCYITNHLELTSKKSWCYHKKIGVYQCILYISIVVL